MDTHKRANGTWYSPKQVANYRYLTQLDYAMITHSIVGFKPKKFDLVQQTIFLLRIVVWGGD